MDKYAPEKLEVPSGSHIAVRYEPTGPVLAMGLQELFGLEATLKIAQGRAPVKLERLAPNYRPVQVTMDLTSFWGGAYQEVLKELRAKYPRHSWPEDPTLAPTVRGPRRRGT